MADSAHLTHAHDKNDFTHTHIIVHVILKFDNNSNNYSHLIFSQVVMTKSQHFYLDSIQSLKEREKGIKHSPQLFPRVHNFFHFRPITLLVRFISCFKVVVILKLKLFTASLLLRSATTHNSLRK